MNPMRKRSIRTKNQKKWRGKDKTNKKEEKIINGIGKIREDKVIMLRGEDQEHCTTYICIYLFIL